MQAKVLPQGKRDELGPAEWDFRSIARTEVEACFIYEYARELLNPRLVELRAQAKDDLAAPKATAETPKEGSPAGQFGVLMCACFPYMASKFDKWFPDTPWQKLDENVRSTLVDDLHEAVCNYLKRLPRHKLSIYTAEQLALFNVSSFDIFQLCHDVGQQDVSQTEYGFFAINWNHADAEIERLFANWLSEQRNGRHKRGLPGVKYKPKGRGGFRDQLNWLGALRVRERYLNSELVDHSNPNRADHYLVVAAPYSHLPDLYENAKKADQVLAVISGLSLGRS